jgi:TatD DNase family protein
MKKYIDLHAHPFKEYFENPHQIIEDSHKAGIDTMMLIGTCVEDSKEVKELASKHTYTFPVIGIHPNDASNNDDLPKLRELMDQSVVAIGEIGFDFHYDDSPSQEQQEIFFRYQVELALEFDVPVIIHSRDSTEATFELLKEYKGKYPKMKIVIHSYSSGPD